MSHKFLQSIRVKHKDGTLDAPIQPGHVKFRAGSYLDVSRNDDNGVVFSANSEYSEVDGDLLLKWQSILTGGSGSYKGEGYSFSGWESTPYYVASLNSVPPVDGVLFLLGSDCTHWGLFQEPIDYPDVAPYRLAITDVCAPCVDCENYEELYEYLDALQNALTDKKKRIVCTRDQVYDSGNPCSSLAPVLATQQNYIMDIYLQLLLYWDWLVHSTTWRKNAEADGQELTAACQYTNHLTSSIPSGFTMDIEFTEIPTVGEPKCFVIDSVGPGATSSLPADKRASYIIGADYTISGLSVTITSPVYHYLTVGDLVRLPNGISQDFGTDRYVVTEITDDKIFIITLVDPLPGGSGIVDVDPVIMARITTTSNLPCGSVIRLYAGALAPKYDDVTGKAKVLFSNNLSEHYPGKAIDYVDKRSRETNNMVAINPADYWDQ